VSSIAGKLTSAARAVFNACPMPVNRSTRAPSQDDQAYAVHFSNPHPLLRLARRPAPHWQFFGTGELTFKPNSIVLRGRRPRPLGFTEQSAEIQLADIINVSQLGKLVRFYVRLPLAAEKLLQLWTNDKRSAQRIARRLPAERTPEFAQAVAQRDAFNQALESIHARSVVTPALVSLNCLVFLWTALLGGGFLEPNPIELTQLGSNFGPFTLDGQWWRLLSSLFMHFGVLHLGLNMVALFQLGRITERLFGSAYFLALYLLSGLCGALASLVMHPTVNSAGASGAVFGVIGALLAFIFKPGTRPPLRAATDIPDILIVLGFTVYSLANGLLHSGIDNSAHIAGLLSGFALGWGLARPLEVGGRRRPVPRLATAAAVALAALFTLSWPLIHPGRIKSAEWHFRHEYELFTCDSRRALAAQSILDRLVSTGRITRREWGERVVRDVLPKWETAKNRFASVQLPAESTLALLPGQITDYLDEKRLALTLFSEAARDNDADKLRLARSVLAKSQLHERQLARELVVIYQSA
jgi:rhomboid protease GluP